MPSINLSQLRNTRQLMAWLEAGLTVELCKRGRVIAHIIPMEQASQPAAPDDQRPVTAA
jgi:antitoxin (DNA-binding transcriptional repressor) of toxin-antitoxin stability system